MIDERAARECLLAAVNPLPAQAVSLAQALGRYLAQPLIAPWDLPLYDHAAMDGFAVNAAATRGASPENPLRLALTPALFAGEKQRPYLSADQAIPIATGARLPLGADAVIRVEEVQHDGQSIVLRQVVPPGRDVRHRGEDVRRKDMVVPAGVRISPARLALLASFGHTAPVVHQKPRVAIVSTGNELVAAEAADGEQPVDANSHYLAASCLEESCEVHQVGIVADDRQALRATIAALVSSADLILTSGGASVGERDLIASVLEELGVEWLFRKVAIKPGRPTLAGKLGSALCVALPGNPPAAATAFEWLVRPLLRRWQGNEMSAGWLEARPLSPMGAPPDVTVFSRGRVQAGTQGLRVAVDRSRSSHWPAFLQSNAWVKVSHARGATPGSVQVLADGHFEPWKTPPNVAVLGASGVGKTTLICRLIAHLHSTLRIAAIKRTHHDGSFDLAGKDSARLTEAGAQAVALVGRRQLAFFQGLQGAIGDSELARLMPDEVDLVISEGFGASALPTILLHQHDLAPPAWLHDPTHASAVLVVVGDACEALAERPRFEREDVAGLAQWILQWMTSLPHRHPA